MHTYVYNCSNFLDLTTLHTYIIIYYNVSAYAVLGIINYVEDGEQ